MYFPNSTRYSDNFHTKLAYFIAKTSKNVDFDYSKRFACGSTYTLENHIKDIIIKVLFPKSAHRTKHFDSKLSMFRVK